MCRVAVERGHSDVGYLLELASQMAAQRENAAALGPIHWQSADEPMAASPLTD